MREERLNTAKRMMSSAPARAVVSTTYEIAMKKGAPTGGVTLAIHEVPARCRPS
jgi:hypothetical protein